MFGLKGVVITSNLEPLQLIMLFPFGFLHPS